MFTIWPAGVFEQTGYWFGLRLIGMKVFTWFCIRVKRKIQICEFLFLFEGKTEVRM